MLLEPESDGAAERGVFVRKLASDVALAETLGDADEDDEPEFPVECRADEEGMQTREQLDLMTFKAGHVEKARDGLSLVHVISPTVEPGARTSARDVRVAG